MSRRLGVALVGVSAPGYRSLALDYLHATVAADARLDVAINRLDTDTARGPLVAGVPAALARTGSRRRRPAGVLLDRAPRLRGGAAREVRAPERARRRWRSGGRPDRRGGARRPLGDRCRGARRGRVRVRRAAALAREGRRHRRRARRDRAHGRRDRELRPTATPVAELDDIPSPFSIDRPIATDGSAYVETYRGCPHACAYCYEGKGSTRIRSFSWERIAADIEAVATTPGMRSFSFIDPVFNLTPDRLARLSEILAPHARRGVRLHTIEVDIERVDDEQAALLAAAGVASVETGPQSVGAAALAACGRAFDAERFAAGVRGVPARRDLGRVRPDRRAARRQRRGRRRRARLRDRPRPGTRPGLDAARSARHVALGARRRARPALRPRAAARDHLDPGLELR